MSETRSYNDDNTLASISYSGAPIGDLSYTWDANKNKTSESIGGVMSGYGFTAGYDAEDRLTGWDRADASLDQSWDLSPVGDWNSITENAAVQNRTHGPVHEILTAAGQAVQHDAKGNMTQIPSSLRPTASPLSLKWDFDNKLRAADTDNDGIDNVFYRWDALGRRVGRDDGSSHVIYFQDGHQTLADYPAGGAAGSPSYTYVYGSYIDEVILRNEGGGTRYYHRNQQYSIIALTDVGGAVVERYAYTAYGQLSTFDPSGSPLASSSSNNRYTYTGREWDAGLSLYHFRARIYDPVAGRFVSRDPIGYKGSEWNLYECAGSMPLASLDPFGLFTCTRTRKCYPGPLIYERGETYRGDRLDRIGPGEWIHTGDSWLTTLFSSNVGPSYFRRDIYYRFQEVQDVTVYMQFRCVDTFVCKCPNQVFTHTTYELRKQWEETRTVGTMIDVGSSEGGTGRMFCNEAFCWRYDPDGNRVGAQPNPQTPVEPPMMPR